ncbi:MAG: UDP-N-acetylmuramoyl-L-alanyl-D-glutamate--2,6-diaminopimelate ligase [Bacteroidales bacterium]
MKLSDLIKNINGAKILGDPQIEITNIYLDSRNVTEGALFIATKGASSDGHNFIESAITNGAKAIICEKIPEEREGICYIVTDNSRRATGLIAKEYYGNPSEKMRVVGITGTNGKTTTVTLLYNLFTSLGYKCGLISTIENFIGKRRVEATHTTPDSMQINSLMSQMTYEGCEFCFIEVSSHALDQERVSGITFEGAIFSNLTHDHLDYHKSYAEYIRVKKLFFDNLPKQAFALTNIDDKNGSVMVQNCKANIYTYSCMSPANFNCKIIESSITGMQIKIGNREIWTRFIGLHNAYNLLAVYSAAKLLGAKEEELLIALSALESVSGRLEYLKGGEELTAVVDYAHTPDALKNVLKTLNEVAEGAQIVTVFGCGGNRDKTKRVEMAQVSALLSDKIVVTSDNPRFEEPEDIIEDIKKGFKPGDNLKTLYITDRREAIKAAITTAKPGSIILVAGKGHETYQEVKGVRHHFDDKEEIKTIFNLMK